MSIVLKGVLIQVFAFVFIIGAIIGVLGGIGFGRPPAFFWGFAVVCAIGLLFMKEMYRQLK